ncbi:hypothetical protein ACFZAD_39195 [Streptomyces iakyrus]|uniref:hypothetical protein n=1 Tax=Streptomyces iakyrus TaxID=68219 RepID=UPI0036F0DEDE
MILVTSGVLTHDVDRITRTVTPGQWLWVRPGHLQCWHPRSTVTGPFILFEPDVLDAGAAPLLAPATAHDAPAVFTPHPDDALWAERTAHQLLGEHRALGRRPLDLHHALRRNPPGSPAAPGPQPRRPGHPLAHHPAQHSTSGSSTPWNSTSANCTTWTTTRGFWAARCAPSPAPPRAPAAPAPAR